MSAATELMKQAQEVSRLFKLAKMPLPPAIERMLGGSGPDGATHGIPTKPPSWQPGWIWVPIAATTPGTLALAVLKESGVAMQVKDALQRASELNSKVVSGSFYNVGRRMEESKLIRRSKEGWEVIDRKKAPDLYEGYVWGPAEIFAQQDVTAHRRLLIEHLLRESPGGLMTMQIVRGLEAMNCMAPVAKDLVKVDMEHLASLRKVKRVGNTRKWRLTEEDN